MRYTNIIALKIRQLSIFFSAIKLLRIYDFGYAGFKEIRQHLSLLTQSNRYLSHIILMRLPWNGGV